MKGGEERDGNMNTLNLETKGVKETNSSNMSKFVEELRGVKAEVIFIKERVDEIMMLDCNEREEWKNKRTELMTYGPLQ